MKGRSNFVLPAGDGHAASLFDEDELFQRLKKWVSRTKTGDITELDFPYPDWPRSAATRTPVATRSALQEERCFSTNGCVARPSRGHSGGEPRAVLQRSGDTHGGPKSALIPDYGAVIFDEAHHLEDVASDIFGIEFSNYRVPQLLNRLKKAARYSRLPGRVSDDRGGEQHLFESFGRVRKQEYFLDELWGSVDRQSVENGVNDLVNDAGQPQHPALEQDTEGTPTSKSAIQGYKNMLSRLRDDLAGLFFARTRTTSSGARSPEGPGSCSATCTTPRSASQTSCVTLCGEACSQ